MKPYIFDSYETDDIAAVLFEVEEYFHFKLEDDELAHVKTFDEFIDIIIDKLPYKDSNTCTSQQAFYKLKNKIAQLGVYDVRNLKPDTKLSEIFLSENNNMYVWEELLGLELKAYFAKTYIRPVKKIIYILNFLPGISFFALLETKLWFMGLGIPFAIIGHFIIGKWVKDPPMETIRDLINRIVIFNYLDCRNNKDTVNKRELKSVLIENFSKQLFMQKEDLITARFSRE